MHVYNMVSKGYVCATSKKYGKVLVQLCKSGM